MIQNQIEKQFSHCTRPVEKKNLKKSERRERDRKRGKERGRERLIWQKINMADGEIIFNILLPRLSQVTVGVM